MASDQRIAGSQYRNWRFRGFKISSRFQNGLIDKATLIILIVRKI